MKTFVVDCVLAGSNVVAAVRPGKEKGEPPAGITARPIYTRLSTGKAERERGGTMLHTTRNGPN